MLTTSGVSITDILKARAMKHFLIPEVDELLAPGTSVPYPFPKTFEQAENDPFLVLHTSGTTGLPKPVTWTHGAVAAQDPQSLVEPFSADEAERRGWQRLRWADVMAGKFTSPFAPFHIIMSLTVPIFTVFGRSTYVYAARDDLPHTPEVMAASELCDTIYANPSTLEEIAQSEEWLKALERFDHVLYAGGALAVPTGKKLSASTRVINRFGSTELGCSLMNGLVAPKDFGSILFDPDLNGIEWRPLGLDGDGKQLYEMVIVRKPELEATQAVFKVVNFQGEKEHRMGDMWVKGEAPETWIYRGRMDDLICFASGIKFNPNGCQEKVKGHAFVKEAILFGEQHAQTVLIVELNEKALGIVDAGEEKEVRESISRFVNKVNEDLPRMARVAQTHVIFAPKDKPFARSPKGSVARFRTVNAFQKDIDECYARYGDQGADILERIEANGRAH